MNVFHISALLLGFASSLHCLGMCGPLVWMLPGGKSHFWLGRIAYHSGRIITYALLGALLGIVGQGIALTGYQQWLSIICGAVMILWFWFKPQTHIPYVSDAFQKHAKPYFTRLMNRPLNTGSFFLMGFLNGLLPCGVVYGALAGALATGAVIEGAFFMALFGMGTAPALLAVSFTKRAGFRIPNANKVARYGLLVAGVLLVLRGANLGIPYLSPKQVTETKTQTAKLDCCKVKKTHP